MRRELGIAKCGLACCLCAQNSICHGCQAEVCSNKEWCENRRCALEKEHKHCFECKQDCRKGMLAKIKPYGFTMFAKRYGENKLLDCLEQNEKEGVVYHCNEIIGDYDGFDDVEKLIDFVLTGKR